MQRMLPAPDVKLRPPAELAARLARGESVVAVFVASWCGHSRRFLRREAALAPPGTLFVDISDEGDPAWDAYRVRLVPTVVRYEGGVERGRSAALPGVGLPPGAFDRLGT